jgi:hypothetical protein
MGERRVGVDRRHRLLVALVRGSLRPRRRGPRRCEALTLASSDWHHPQWLVVSSLILLLSFADALLTLALLAHGAAEANPVMARLVNASAARFALGKMGLTGVGVVVLTLVARARVGRLPVSAVLYAILCAYCLLIGYEIALLWGMDPAP